MWIHIKLSNPTVKNDAPQTHRGYVFQEGADVTQCVTHLRSLITGAINKEFLTSPAFIGKTARRTQREILYDKMIVNVCSQQFFFRESFISCEILNQGNGAFLYFMREKVEQKRRKIDVCNNSLYSGQK